MRRLRDTGVRALDATRTEGRRRWAVVCVALIALGLPGSASAVPMTDQQNPPGVAFIQSELGAASNGSIFLSTPQTQQFVPQITGLMAVEVFASTAFGSGTPSLTLTLSDINGFVAQAIAMPSLDTLGSVVSFDFTQSGNPLNLSAGSTYTMSLAATGTLTAWHFTNGDLYPQGASSGKAGTDYMFRTVAMTSVPEPQTAILVALGLVTLGSRVRRRSQG